MNLIPGDENNDEFMNANAEEWSKPKQPADRVERSQDPTDRWGSPISTKQGLDDGSRWGSEPIKTNRSSGIPSSNKPKSKWWIIAIITVVMLCLCLCAVSLGLSYFGINLFNRLSI